jgi:hypothetical protein
MAGDNNRCNFKRHRCASIPCGRRRRVQPMMEGPNMVSRDLVPIAAGCASPAGIGKPLGLAAPIETDPS